MKRVSLPQHSWLDHQTASFGSRLLAYLLDLTIRWSVTLLAILLFVYLIIPLFVEALPFDLLVALFTPQLLLALLIFAIFVVETFYPVFFETWRNGQTPGKKMLGLRVVTEQGLPITFKASLLRNTLAAVDALPGAGGVALVSMLLSPNSQRLGDHLAGTLVIYDQPVGEEAQFAFPKDHAPVFIPPALYQQIHSFLARKNEISESYRGKAEKTLLSRLRSSVDDTLWQRDLAGLSIKEIIPIIRPLPKQYTENDRPAQYDWSSAREEIRDAEKWVDKLEGERPLSHQELKGIASRYQRLCERYASLTTFYPGICETRIAAAAVRRGRALIHGTRQEAPSSQEGFFKRVAQGFEACASHCAFSCLLLFGSALLTATIIAIHPDLGWHFIPESTGEKLSSGRLWTDEVRGMSPLAASSIMTNNIKVAFTAFALGIAGGVGTILVLIFNGAHLGGTFFVLGRYEMASRLGDFVLAHGFLELSVIVVAAGAGLFIGDGLINPGFTTRWEAVRARAKTVTDLLIFSALCLIPAGLIEGFISPYEHPLIVKLTLGVLVALMYWCVLITQRIRSYRAASERDISLRPLA